jgi:hypothetical protein
MKCDRCKKETVVTTMSWLNTQTICMDCDEKEQDHPRFKEAKERERQEMLNGNYNYEGLLG